MQRLSDLPIGAKVKDTDTKYGGRTITWLIADKNHRGYPSNTVTFISEKILLDKRFDGSTGIYRDSELRRWINDNNGLLKDFRSDFKNAIVDTSVSAETGNTTDKIFLASEAELIPGRDSREGYALPLFTKLSESRISKDFNNNNKPWWMRSGFESYSSTRPLIVTDGGGFYYSGPNETYGVRPLFNVKSDIKVSDYKDSSGSYTITWNQPPIIESTTSTNMGTKSSSFGFSYKVRELDSGQSLTVEEYVDNSRTKQFSANSGSTYNFALTGSAFKKLLNGNHSIKIVARDNQGGVAEKVFYFSKNETKILFTLERPLVADAMVTKAIINVVGSIPDKAILKVEVCNNGNDRNPTWEDCTEQAIGQKKIFLRNKQKTASKWGFNVRVSVDRNGATGECYISSIGGNFE